MTEATIRVYCDAPSHSTKKAFVDRLVVSDGGNGKHILRDGEDSARLIGDAVIGRKELFGGSRVGPSRWDAHRTRERRVLECPLCGLHVELTMRKALLLAEGLATRGESRVRLSDLAASLT